MILTHLCESIKRPSSRRCFELDTRSDFEELRAAQVALETIADGWSASRTLGQKWRSGSHCLAANGLELPGHTVSYCADLRLPFSRSGSDIFTVAAIPAARSFAIRLMSFTGTGLVSVKWTVPFRRS